MSQICENCRIHLQVSFTPTVPIVRQDAATGYLYHFCSENCAEAWVEKRKQPPPTQRTASAKPDEHQQVEERWLSDGGSDLRATG